MPFKTEHLYIKCDFLEKRTKLLLCQKEMIVYWHNNGLSQRKLAAMFSVSRRLIQFVIDPEKLKQNKQARLDRGGTMQYYNKAKHNEYQKKHRKYKNEILSHLI